MSTKKNITLAGVDCTNYVKDGSISVSYQTISGLSDVWTEDLVLHDDPLGYLRVFTFEMNITNEATALIILNILKQPTITVTITDPAVGRAETIYCRPSMPKAAHKLTNYNGISYWKLDGVELTERSGYSV